MTDAEREPNLYELGWRQGSIFDAALPADTVVLGLNGAYQREQQEHGTWLVATQDCDLAVAPSTCDRASIELRPVLSAEPPADWGIRSRRLGLTDAVYLVAESPRTMISPAALVALGTGRAQAPLAPGRTVALKTWLGLRYDRPAVPDSLVKLVQAIASRASNRPGRLAGEMIHDVLIQFDTTGTPPNYRLFAVIADAADREAVRSWLGSIGAAVSADLGVMAGYDLGTKAETSLELVENSFAADLSRLTWRGENPTGAV